jgi:hypothetical protein
VNDAKHDTDMVKHDVNDAKHDANMIKHNVNDASMIPTW